MNGVRTAKRKGASCAKSSSIYASESVRAQYCEQYLICLISDAKCMFQGRYSNADATLDIIRIKSRIRSEGSGFATKTLPTLIKGLLDLKEHGVASFPQFKLQRGTEHPAFLGRLFNLAINSVDSEVETKALSFIYTFAVSFKKLKGDYPLSVIRRLFSDFVKTDMELDEINWFSEPIFPILEEARAQWRNFVDHSRLRQLLENTSPQPGPGATNTSTKKHMRYRPHVFYKQLNNVMPYDEWFYPNQYYIFLEQAEFEALTSATFNSPTARFKAVPKTVGKPRGICIEENETQTLQQAIRKAFYMAIEKYFKDNIPLRNQSVNAVKAQISSETLEDATIDESEASDRVARELVSWMSQDDKVIHNLLMGLSTRYVLPPEELTDEYDGPVKTKKFAPMGSALCFPIMSLVHMFLVRAIMKLSVLDDYKTLAKRVHVYGDDIILPVEAVEAVYTYLPMFGMKLNKDKSFFKSHFRESCGIHAYKGVNVTPVYVKHVPFHDSSDAQASVFAVEAQLFDKGLYHTAKFQRQCIESTYGIKPCVVPSGLSLVGYTRPSDVSILKNYKNLTRRKWNRNLQCYTYTVSRFVKRTEKLKVPSQLDAYVRWLWLNTECSDTVSDSFGSLTRIRRTVPESAFGDATFGTRIDKSLKQCPTASQVFNRRPGNTFEWFLPKNVCIGESRLQ